MASLDIQGVTKSFGATKVLPRAILGRTKLGVVWFPTQISPSVADSQAIALMSIWKVSPAFLNTGQLLSPAVQTPCGGVMHKPTGRATNWSAPVITNPASLPVPS